MNLIVRLVDLVGLTAMFGTMTVAYKPRYSVRCTVLAFILCLAAAQLQILAQEYFQVMHFLFYILSYVLWGCIYSVAFLKEQAWQKIVMVVAYCSAAFFSFDICFSIRSILPSAPVEVFQFLRIVSLLICAYFICRHAIHTSRAVPTRCRLSFLTVCIVFLSIYYTTHHKQNALPINMNALISMFLMLSQLIIFYLFSHLIQHYENDVRRVALSQTIQAESNMVHESMRLARQMRSLRHELNNHISTVLALLDEGKTQEVYHLLNEVRRQPLLSAHQTLQTGNPVANAILHQKITEAEHLGIAIHVQASLDSNLPIKDSQLSSLLSNLLNNAIEASQLVDHPSIDVNIYPIRSYLCFCVKNRADIQLLNRNPTLTTTKNEPDLHGFGLSVIRQIAERYHGSAVFETDAESHCFIAQVMLLIAGS